MKWANVLHFAAAERFFSEKNLRYDPSSTRGLERIDFHRLRPVEAIERLNKHIAYCKALDMPSSTLICGKGLHSGEKGSSIRRVIMEGLEKSSVLGWEVMKSNPGRIKVIFQTEDRTRKRGGKQLDDRSRPLSSRNRFSPLSLLS